MLEPEHPGVTGTLEERRSTAAEVHAQVQAACAEIESLCQAAADPFNHAEQVALYERIKVGAG